MGLGFGVNPLFSLYGVILLFVDIKYNFLIRIVSLFFAIFSLDSGTFKW